MGDYPFFWNLALPNQYLGRNLGPRNPFNGKRHRQSKETPNTATLQPFSSPLSSLYMTSLKLFNLNHRKRNNWKYKSLRRRNNNLGISTLGTICGHLTRFSYIPSETLAFICHELLKCTLSVKNELLFLHISTLKYIGYGQVGATEETQISIIEHIVFGGIWSPYDHYNMSVKKVWWIERRSSQNGTISDVDRFESGPREAFWRVDLRSPCGRL